jgi:prepilin signal peptidase PulO-like enzyme (type II secretory pathway)
MELYFFVGILGLVIGSFLNVVILRVMEGRDLNGRSGCPHCAHTLKWYELIPVLSYLVQKGRCRACAHPISPQYPLVELLTSAVFVGVLHVQMEMLLTAPLYLGLLYMLAHLCMWSILVVIAVYDLRTTYIPDIFSYSLAGIALLTLFLQGLLTAPYALPSVSALLAGPLLFLPFYLLSKISDEQWMGYGDGKLALGMGWMLGIGAGLSAVVLSFWIGAVVMLGLMGLQRVYARIRNVQGAFFTYKSKVPFGPFLILGCGLQYFLEYAFLATLYVW